MEIGYTNRRYVAVRFASTTATNLPQSQDGMMLFLIGSSHSYQKGLAVAPTGCYDEFKGMVRRAALNNFVMTIGEEMSQKALGVTVSLCKEVAKELGIFHIFCDPNKAEREAFGLPAKDCPSTWSLREYEWLHRLNDVQFPALFVCGADHVNSFAKKCGDQSINVEVLERDWKPTKIIPLEYRII